MILIFVSECFSQSFLEQQLKYSRVKTAQSDKIQKIDSLLKSAGLNKNEFYLFLQAIKENGELTVFAKNKNESVYQELIKYRICSKSGILGPKSSQGDKQVPEGVYFINRFNPTSNFYLSLGINYPNTADLKRIGHANPGGDIFIHGSCVTIGCLPMTDEFIKEIYLLAVLAKNNGQNKIPVFIFPFEMSANNLRYYSKKHPGNKLFWENLSMIYQSIIKYKKLPVVQYGKSGEYIIEN
ncbi:MAG: L,D-transpeptidase family protein [Bacteroidia bacterium]